MAIREMRSGPLYVSIVSTSVQYCLPHTVGVVQIHSPWRRGRAWALPCYPYKALALGWWKKTPVEDDVDPDFADDLWLSPRWLANVPVDEIADWGLDVQEETASTVSGP